MALVLADRVKETTTTTGPGTITLLGASFGFQSFAVVGDANTTYYCIAGQTTNEWEVGIGTYTASGTTLARTTVLSNSSATQPSVLSFGAGTKDVFVVYPASRSVYADGTILTASNSSILPAGSGGTGVTTTPTNGQLLIGNGTNYTVATLGSGTGISTTAGTGTLTINNTGVTSNVAGTGITVSSATGAVTVSIGQAVATSSDVQFNSLGVGTAGSATAGEIRATNNITAFYSDERLKTKIGDIEDPLGKIHAIRTMLYHANEIAVSLGYDASIQEVGVSAQSVQAVQPEAVAPAPIDERYLTVRYEKLIPLLIEAIKALDRKVNALAKLE